MITTGFKAKMLALCLAMPMAAMADVVVVIEQGDLVQSFSLELNEESYPKSIDFEIEGTACSLKVVSVEADDRGVSCGCAMSITPENQEAIVNEVEIAISWDEPFVAEDEETGVKIVITATR